MMPVIRSSLLTFPTLIVYVSIVFSIIAYHQGGGFRKYLGTFREIAIWGWFLIPIFPVDLFIGLVIVCGGFMLMLYLPIIYISLHMKSIRKKMAKAEEYIQRQEQINALNAQANSL